MDDETSRLNTEDTSAEPSHSGRLGKLRREEQQKPRRAIFGAIVIALVCALIVGTLLIVHASASGASGARPSLLRATRTLGLWRDRSPMLRIVANPQSVQRLYGVILRLPRLPRNGIYNCPSDDGTTWTLTFWSAASMVARVVVNEYGCQFLSINGRDWRMTAVSNFWQVFAATIALPPQQV